MRLLTFVRQTTDTELCCEMLQLTLSRLGADKAVERVVGNDQLEHRGACVQHTYVVCFNHHPLLSLGHAGWRQVTTSLNLHDAYTASPGLVLYTHVAQFEMAQCRYLNAHLAGSL